MPIRVVIVEDHPLVLRAIVQDLDEQPDIEVVGTAEHGSKLHQLVKEASPDIVVLDLGMSEGEFEPANAVRTLLQSHPDVRVLVLTGYDNEIWVRLLFEAGAQGYVLKSENTSLCLPEGVRQVYRGGRFYSPKVAQKLSVCQESGGFTSQELGILHLAAHGLSNARIAQELILSQKTVRNYFCNIYIKLGIDADKDLNPRVVAINRARELGLLREED